MIAKLVAFVVPLGLDTFAVGAALGAAGLAPPRRLRVSLLMAGFEAAMPLVGLAIGAPLGRAVGSAADYVAVGVLLAFGLYTVFGADGDEERKLAALGGVDGWPAVVLGISISLDELAIGFTLGLLQLPVYAVVILIAVQALVLSQLGMRLGSVLSDRLREGAERAAGVALVGLGAGLLVEKLL